ncbi:SurA N-terminal domain-containing protein [Alteromonas halophila]|uniref:Periplasmic chaperone PpiD n=1 Tax=Alteromonas halophila TaxID=516698 RepID=A0A918MZQ1_9ALTE|nr:SurA N-terminal domain-containing protein [Alteromonas halophila]GGW86256.1 peptidylprolyl isomerase [Alteromonas halophila]
MLERIREGSQGPWAMAIIALIVLSFVFAGVGSYLTSSGSTAAATVNGEEISAQELERAYQNQRGRMESQYGESISQLFASEEYMRDFRRNVLDRLIGEKLVQQKAEELGLRVSDEQIRDAIVNMQEFQYNGEFDNERFKTILRQNGFQVTDFRDYLRTQMTQSQLAAALSNSEFTLPSELKRANALQQQSRDARYLTVEAQPFTDNVSLSDDEIQSYYDANIASFDTQEKVQVEFVLLDANDLTDDVSVTDEEIETYYQNNQNAYRTDEERRVSHILIEAGDDEAAAQDEAQALLEEIKGGADFAELAETSSDDTFSAENGGDLEFITRDMMDPAFDEAAFALENVGDVSEVVETEFGFHIIKLTDIKPEQVTSLDDVRGDIRETLAKDKALDTFYEMQNTMAELAFEVPDTLDDVASAIGAEVNSTELFTRESAPAPLDTQAAVDVAFSDELIQDRLNSDVIELGDESVVVMRVARHEPQRTKQLDEVKSDISTMLKAQKAQNAALDWAQQLVADMTNGESVEARLEEKGLEWQTAEQVTRNGGSLPRNMVDTLFVLSSEQGQNVDVTKTVSGDAAVVELLAINAAPALEGEQATAFRQRLTTMTGQQMYQQYVEALREQAEITVSENL